MCYCRKLVDCNSTEDISGLILGRVNEKGIIGSRMAEVFYDGGDDIRWFLFSGIAVDDVLGVWVMSLDVFSDDVHNFAKNSGSSSRTIFVGVDERREFIVSDWVNCSHLSLKNGRVRGWIVENVRVDYSAEEDSADAVLLDGTPFTAKVQDTVVLFDELQKFVNLTDDSLESRILYFSLENVGKHRCRCRTLRSGFWLGFIAGDHIGVRVELRVRAFKVCCMRIMLT